jgi:hypothetical protein
VLCQEFAILSKAPTRVLNSSRAITDLGAMLEAEKGTYPRVFPPAPLAADQTCPDDQHLALSVLPPREELQSSIRAYLWFIFCSWLRPKLVRKSRNKLLLYPGIV